MDTALLSATAVFHALHPGDVVHQLLAGLCIGGELLVLGLASRWINNDPEDYLQRAPPVATGPRRSSRRAAGGSPAPGHG